MEQPIKVLTFGTFDLLHEGHISYLLQAKALGDELYVLVACDQAVRWAKGRASQEPEGVRLKNIKKLPFVDYAWVGEPVKRVEDYIKPIHSIAPDIICLGYDQALNEESWLRFAVRAINPSIQIIRANSYHPEIYKSSKLKKRL